MHCTSGVANCLSKRPPLPPGDRQPASPVVWFGEMPLGMARIEESLKQVTSSWSALPTGLSAAGLRPENSRGHTAEINLEAGGHTRAEHIAGPACDTVPEFLVGSRGLERR